MAKRTSKSIAERIDVDYYRKPHPLREWKRKCSWAAFFASLAAILVITFVLNDHRMYQAGPVSDYHQIIANDCEACHTQPWQTGMRLVSLSEAHRTVPDETCEACHAGPAHNPNEITEDVQRCAECHREHRGSNELATVANAACIRCHSDLKTKDGSHQFEQSIIAFANHPEFKIIKEKTKDPGTIRFNHAVHLAEPMLQPFGHGKEPDGLEKVSLQCVDCHQPDESRKYMLPVKYDQHCARCHDSALTFDPKRFPDQPVKHGVQVDVVRGVLRERYAHYVKENREEVLGSAESQGKRMPWRSLPVELDKEEYQWVNNQVAVANDVILNRQTGCAYCHEVESDDKGAPSRVVAAAIPDRWFTHSVFQHDSHRMLNCEACHEGVKDSKLTSDVLLPGVDNCRKCHGPTSVATGAARDDCVECHVYHDHKQDRDFNGPFPLDPSRWSAKPEASPSETPAEPTPAPTQASGPAGSAVFGAADLLHWLQDK